MAKFNYTKGSGSSNEKLEPGDYEAMVTKAELANIKGVEKLIIEMAVVLPNGETTERTEFVRPETWIPLFTDLLEASGQDFSEEGGEFDTDYLVGVEGTLRIVHNQGTGQHEGKVFDNAERFLPKEEKKDEPVKKEDSEKKS